MTPSDLDKTILLGMCLPKSFPAEAAGGIKFLLSLAAPYSHQKIRFIPTGAINTGNVGDYLAMEEVLAVGGTQIAKKNSN